MIESESNKEVPIKVVINEVESNVDLTYTFDETVPTITAIE